MGGKQRGRKNTDLELSNLRTFEYKIEIDFLSAFQTAILDQIPTGIDQCSFAEVSTYI